VLLNNGNGTFANRVDVPTGNRPESVAAADLNGDGKSDLAVANFGSGTLSVLLNNGDGSFAPKVDYPTGSVPQSVAAADLNGDGTLIGLIHISRIY
ncbi:MAG TPA: VCBS repeat-containing protein, partial [Saprospiraceae bacterium]|nr:VCBS repeat-containing protein [Saprospiraceae bacterium]